MPDDNKFVSDENLAYFKNKQDAANDAEFAKKSEIPTNVSQLTNDSGYQNESQVSALIQQAVASVFTFKGSKATSSELPSSEQKVGDVWHVEDTGAEYAWDGSEWQELGTIMTVTWESIQSKPSTFTPSEHTHTKAQISDLAEWAKADTKPEYTYNEVGAASATHSHTPFVGASSSSEGQSGFVPAPTAGQEGMCLMGDGTWKTPDVGTKMEAMTNDEIDALF